MDKLGYRKLYRVKRAALAQSEMLTFIDLILIQFQQLKLEIPDVLMTYAASEKLKEYDPRVVVDYCFFKNPALRLAYPVMLSDNGMQAVEVKEDTSFIENDRGIDEPVDGMVLSPAELEMILVPVLAFDVYGNRVGYGKGYYDRYLAQTNPGCTKIGFSFFEAEESIPKEHTDVPLDYCITPSQVYTFTHK